MRNVRVLLEQLPDRRPPSHTWTHGTRTVGYGEYGAYGWYAFRTGYRTDGAWPVSCERTACETIESWTIKYAPWHQWREVEP